MSAINSNLSVGNVANLASSIAGAASSIAYATTQTLTRAIDAIASPSTLRNIANVAGEVVTDVVNGAADLLNLRTTLAKGQTPPFLPTTQGLQESGTLSGPEDRQILSAIGSGRYTSGSTVTFSDGSEQTVTENEDGSWTVG